MSWGEVELDEDPGAYAPDTPIDLSELDLVAPRETGASGIFGGPRTTPEPPGGAPELGVGAGEARASSPELAMNAAEAPKERRPRTIPGGMLWGMPRSVALAVLGLVGVGVLLGAYLILRPKKGEPTASGGKPTVTSDSTPKDKTEPVADSGNKVAYLPSMDLDTKAGYLEAARTHQKRYKQRPSASLRAARAKALLAAAYRYAAPKKAETARKLLGKLGEEDGPELLKARALDALLEGKRKQARTMLRTAAKSDADDPEIPLLVGWVELEDGRTDRAEKAFRRALDLRGESAGARFGLVQALAARDERGTRGERSDLLARIRELSPDHAQAQVALLTLAPPENPREARNQLTALLERMGKDASHRERGTIQMGLAKLALKEGELDKALALLAETSGAPNSDPALLHLEGITRLEAGDLGLGVTRLEGAMEAMPQSTEVLEGLVRGYLLQGELKKAEDALEATIKRLEKSTRARSKPEKAMKGGPSDQPGAPTDGAVMKAETRDTTPTMAPSRRRRRTARPVPDERALRKRPNGSRPDLRDPWLDLTRGHIAEAKGELEEARRHFLAATSTRGDFTAAHAAYLALLYRQGQFEGMKTSLELLRARYQEALPEPLVLNEGRMLIGLGKAAAGEKVLRAGFERHPGSNVLLVELAQCLWRHVKKPEEAILLLESMMKRASGLLHGVQLLADLYWARREPDRAVEHFEAARKKLRTEALDLALADFLLRSPTPAHLKRARELVDPILEENPRNHAALVLGALVKLGEGDPKEAILLVRRAQVIAPTIARYKSIEAHVLAQSGEPRRALAIYAGLLEARPGDIALLYARTRIFCRYRDTKKCLRGAREIIRRQEEPEAYLLEGQGLLQERAPAKALRSFRKAIALDRGHAEAHFLVGRTLYDEGDYRQAIGSLRQSLDRAEEAASFVPDIHYLLGMAYHRAESKSLATQHLKTYLSGKGNPQNPETGVQRQTAKETLQRIGP